LRKNKNKAEALCKPLIKGRSLVLEHAGRCPPKKRAAATKPARQDGFAAALPSRGFRDGTGIFVVKLRHYPRVDTPAFHG
jgi:hypothetical protein